MWLHIIACLLALIGVVPAITMLSPVRVAHRAMPLIMIIASLFVWFLPTGIDVALALVPLAAWISARLGIEHAGHEPVNVGPAVELARRGAQRIQERLTWAEPVEVKQFVDRAYPAPGKAATGDLEATDAEDEDLDDDELSPAENMTSKLEAHASDPRLPVGLRNQLASQRDGRNRTISAVPQFVPSL